jgi:diaminohydroxyphosphoribosylaminopyrimidine deaminase / 5-amino-6-(5-phosphoribosylamino)uracil reductase
MRSSDSDHMARALGLAERGRGRTSPNPMVGAVVVDAEGVVVGRGAHEFAGGLHAEVHALRDAGERARGATLYCTLEPCSHTGRTGPCAPLVATAGIGRAVIAMEDPNPLVAGRGIGYLRDHGIEVRVGVGAAEAARLNRAFLTAMHKRRPYVVLKAALSLDGYVAAAPGTRTKLTGPAADRAIHRFRAEIDALAVGSGTILTDDPLLTARGAYRCRPLQRVIFDRSLRTPPSARVLSTLAAGPVIIMSTAAAARAAPSRARSLADAGARLEFLETDVDNAGWTRAAVHRLLALDITCLLVEGGPALHRAVWQSGVVDCVQVFVTPAVLGSGSVPWLPADELSLAALQPLSPRPIGEDILMEAYVHRVD